MRRPAAGSRLANGFVQYLLCFGVPAQGKCLLSPRTDNRARIPSQEAPAASKSKVARRVCEGDRHTTSTALALFSRDLRSPCADDETLGRWSDVPLRAANTSMGFQLGRSKHVERGHTPPFRKRHHDSVQGVISSEGFCGSQQMEPHARRAASSGREAELLPVTGLPTGEPEEFHEAEPWPLVMDLIRW